MSILVKSIDVYTIEDRIRKDKTKEGKEEWHYVKALKDALTRQQQLTGEAISKLRKRVDPQDVNKLLSAFSTLRHGLFKDADAVNGFIDKTVNEFKQKYPHI